MSLIDLTGKRFGRLFVRRRFGRSKHKQQAKWFCKCDCGGSAICVGSNLRNGKSTSCGCRSTELINQFNFKHGHGSGNKTPEYRSWMSMKNRCLRKEDVAFHRYGGRGITICKRWLSFENFLSDMGPRPAGKTLGRIDGNRDYTPENCEWQTWAEQNDPKNKPYHTWLLSQRIWCKRCSDLTKATHVRNFQGEDICLCQTHASRLDAVRESEKKQETHK